MHYDMRFWSRSLQHYCVAQLVERHPDTVKVAGSNPAAVTPEALQAAMGIGIADVRLVSYAPGTICITVILAELILRKRNS